MPLQTDDRRYRRVVETMPKHPVGHGGDFLPPLRLAGQEHLHRRPVFLPHLAQVMLGLLQTVAKGIRRQAEGGEIGLYGILIDGLAGRRPMLGDRNQFPFLAPAFRMPVVKASRMLLLAVMQ